MQTIKSVLENSISQLTQAGVLTPRLDTEVLLAHTLGVGREYLAAHPEKNLSTSTIKSFAQLVSQRQQRVPIAYLTGHKEFYGLDFRVTADVLVPRPETEDLVELALELDQKKSWKSTKVLDAGCGSGCIGITLKLEKPEWDITLSDISSEALKIADQNATKLGVDVTTIQSDLLSSSLLSSSSFDAIVANLPYVDRTWQVSPELAHEPAAALYAEEGGLRLIYKLIKQSTGMTTHLLLEADPEQHQKIINFAKKHGFCHKQTKGYALSLRVKSA